MNLYKANQFNICSIFPAIDLLFTPSEPSPMPDSQSLGAPLDARRRRALFRSWHRGMREMDLLMGRFADAQLAGLSEAELDDFEALIEAPDRDIFGWLTGEVDIPPAYDTPVFRKVLAFHTHAGPIEL
jgi:antitoxin CptB